MDGRTHGHTEGTSPRVLLLLSDRIGNKPETLLRCSPIFLEIYAIAWTSQKGAHAKVFISCELFSFHSFMELKPIFTRAILSYLDSSVLSSIFGLPLKKA